MSLKDNTVTVKFLHIVKSDDSKQFTIHSHNLYSRAYNFYLPEKFRQQVDMGSVIINQNEDYIAIKKAHKEPPFMAGIIIDNFDDPDSETKNQPITKVYEKGHLRTYLNNEFGLKRDAKLTTRFYKSFRNFSHDYWERVNATKEG